MIHEVDETLHQLLAKELAKVPGCPVRNWDQITFDFPTTAESVQDGEAHVNLYLHDLRENLDLRDESFRVMRADKDGVVGRRRAPVHLNLSYLVTVHAGDDTITEHRLLGDVLGVLLRALAVPAEYMAGSLKGKSSNALPLEVIQPNHTAYGDPASVWQALGGRLRPTLNLKVTAPFDPFETKWTQVVREAMLSMGPIVSHQGHNGAREAITGPRIGAVGIVLDQQSEQPLAQVGVSAQGRIETASTDERGLFVLNLPCGSHTLLFDRRGYARHAVEITAPGMGRSDQLDPIVIALRGLSDSEWADAEAARALADLAETGMAEVAVRQRTIFSGRLRFSDGHPAAYIPVCAEGQRTVTDGDGLYCFNNLPTQPHKFIAIVPGQGEVELTAQNGRGLGTLPPGVAVGDDSTAAEVPPEPATASAKFIKQKGRNAL